MNKGFSWFFLFLSAVFFIFIVGLTGYRIEDARTSNGAFARERLPGLAAKARSIRDSTGGFDAPQFKKDMREVFDEEPRLLLLSVRSPEDGILYLVARNRTYMKEPSPVTPAWRGTPAYQVSKGYELLLSAEMGDDRVPLTLDAMFVIMGREDLYPIVRDDLYLFLAFLLVCGVVILIATSVQESPPETHGRSVGVGGFTPSPSGPDEQARGPMHEQSYASARPVQPQVIQPQVIQPQVIQPQVIQPQVIQPQVIQPKVIQTQQVQSRQEQRQQEPLRPEPTVPEPYAYEPPLPEPQRQEAPREEPQRQEAPREEPLRREAPREEPLRREAPREEPPHLEPPLQESPQPTARDLTSPRTGLVWGEHLESRLHAELERAAVADQDVALARVQIDEPFVDSRLPMVFAAIAGLLREIFPLHDLIFEAGDDSYTLILPDSEVDAAVRVLDDFRSKVAGSVIEGRTRTVSIGVSSRGGRLIEDSTLLEEASVSAAKASREGGNQVIGFRADPARYRDSLSAART